MTKWLNLRALKMKGMLLVLKILEPCRMEQKGRSKNQALCYLCMERGGWPRCRKSRKKQNR